MFTEKDIKPIPKYIENLIRKKDQHSYNKYSSGTRFYSYLTKWKNELMQVYVAVKSSGRKWFCKQVAIHFMHNKKCAIKDIAFYWLAGYVVGWYEQGLSKNQKCYEGDWDIADDKYFNMYAPVVNQEYALKFDKYKYSAVDRYHDTNILKYLRLYEKYPIAEMLIKIGLGGYATSKMLLSKLTKDKAFRKWIYNHRTDIYFNSYYVSTILLAYKENKPLKEIQSFEELKKSFIRNDIYKNIKKYIAKNEIDKFLTYINKQDIYFGSYSDYLTACEYLNLDMTLPKNKYPHDFKKWHDIRIDEYHTAKALQKEKERRAFLKDFKNVAEKYISLQRNLKDSFIVVIAKSPADLVKEGKILHHCVGRMNYDQKFVREESLIFFIRNKDNPTTPFVTIEYSLKNHKVLQCYGDHDSKPAEEVLEFVNKKWLPYANRKLRNLVA